MKRYKLIRKYPGSPELGTIVMNGIIGVNKNTPNLSFDGSRRLRDIELPHKYPEFWEEVKNNNPYNLEIGKTYLLKPKYFTNDNPITVKITRFTNDGFPYGEYSNGQRGIIGEWIVIKEVFEYPIGTKVLNQNTNTIYTRKEDGWYKPAEKTSYTDEIISNRKYITLLDGNESKIIEKDYEILSIKHIKSGNIYKHDSQLKNTFCITDGEAPFVYLDEVKKHTKVYQIHSIKRLSDGEIFTIGDIDNFGKITGFVIRENKIVSQYYRIGDWQWLSSIQHIKKPLFTTEDGVDIYDKYFDIYIVDKSLNMKFRDKKDFSVKPSEKVKYFSTKEAAEEYILMNKPCLSFNEIIKYYNTWTKNKTKDKFFDGLKKIIENKL